MKVKVRTILMLAICFSCLSLASFSQSDKIVTQDGVVYQENVNDPLTDNEIKMIKEVYGDKTQEMVLSNPELLKDFKSLLRNRIKIIQISDPSKQKECKLLSEVPLNNQFNHNLKRVGFKDLESFNPLMYRLDFFAKGSYLYRIDNTDYFIQLTSQYRR